MLGLAVCGTLMLNVGCETAWQPESHTLNASFDEWCGDVPCEWLLEEGRVEPVPTWHPADLAASFIGERVSLSQLLERDDARGASCIRIDVLLDVEAGAKVWLEIDDLDDGSVEWTREVTATDFEPQQVRVRLPEGPRDFRLRAVKEGVGEAALAMLRGVQDVSTCPDTPFDDTAE